MPRVKSFVAINKQTFFIRIVGHKFDLIIINCYAPTEEKKEMEGSILQKFGKTF